MFLKLFILLNFIFWINSLSWKTVGWFVPTCTLHFKMREEEKSGSTNFFKALLKLCNYSTSLEYLKSYKDFITNDNILSTNLKKTYLGIKEKAKFNVRYKWYLLPPHLLPSHLNDLYNLVVKNDYTFFVTFTFFPLLLFIYYSSSWCHL